MGTKKDKFAQMQKQGGGVLNSFQTLAATAAAIDRQTDQPQTDSQQHGEKPAMPIQNTEKTPQSAPDTTRFMRLPNPQIPVREYNLVSQYCNSFSNMTRQDFVELAIIEKLHRDQQMSDEEFNARQSEIRNRPSRGQRKGTKQSSK